jgi:hypothetical protein
MKVWASWCSLGGIGDLYPLYIKDLDEQTQKAIVAPQLPEYQQLTQTQTSKASNQDRQSGGDL